MPTLTSFAQVCAELDRRRHITLGFGRIEALLTAMGHPQRDLPGLVQVVGTNGKGTTALASRRHCRRWGIRQALTSHRTSSPTPNGSYSTAARSQRRNSQPL